MKKHLIAITLILTAMALPAVAEDFKIVKATDSLETRLKGFQERDKAILARLAELERKVAGMQRQITILHAKKADKN